jgi:hypothetical protein
VITAITQGADLGSSGMRGLQETEMEATLLTLPLYQALRDREPQTYTTVLHQMHAAMSSGASPSDIHSQCAPVIGEVVKRRLPFASDDAIVAYAHLALEEERVLQSVSGELCFAYVRGDRQGAAANRYFSAKMNETELEINKQILLTADMSRKMPSAAEVAPAVTKVYAMLERSVGPSAALLLDMNDATKLAAMNKQDWCRVIIGYYTAILHLPRRDAVRLLRYLVSIDAKAASKAGPQ